MKMAMRAPLVAFAMTAPAEPSGGHYSSTIQVIR